MSGRSLGRGWVCPCARPAPLTQMRSCVRPAFSGERTLSDGSPSTMTSSSNTYDVIVVGAGISGRPDLPESWLKVRAEAAAPWKQARLQSLTGCADNCCAAAAERLQEAIHGAGGWFCCSLFSFLSSVRLLPSSSSQLLQYSSVC